MESSFWTSPCLPLIFLRLSVLHFLHSLSWSVYLRTNNRKPRAFQQNTFFFLYDNSTASSNTVSPAGGFVFSLFCLCVFIPSFPINDYYFDEWDVSPDTTVSVKWQRAMQMFSFFFFFILCYVVFLFLKGDELFFYTYIFTQYVFV